MQQNDVYAKLNTRPKTLDDILLNLHKKVSATVNIPANTTLNPCDPLVTLDGGKTFNVAFKIEYDTAKIDYKTDAVVVHAGRIYTALVNDPAANTITDDTKWRDDGEYKINGVALITFQRETKDDPETLKCAVGVDCELSATAMYNFNEATRVAGFPNILMR